MSDLLALIGVERGVMRVEQIGARFAPCSGVRLDAGGLNIYLAIGRDRKAKDMTFVDVTQDDLVLKDRRREITDRQGDHSRSAA